MKVKVVSSEHFEMSAENDAERAILGDIAKKIYSGGYSFGMFGSCYELDYSAYTSIGFGVFKPEKKSKRGALARLLKRG